MCDVVLDGQPQDAAITSEYQLKGAFLLNFARYTEWPDGAFATPSSPLRICVPAPNPFGTALEQLADGETVGAHPVAVRVFATLQGLTGCHLVFVPRSLGERTEALLTNTRGAPVLTVGESPGFTQAGGIINLVNVDGRIRFEINAAAARDKGLDISSRLLALSMGFRQH
jgi:hypothetical protein